MWGNLSGSLKDGNVSMVSGYGIVCGRAQQCLWSVALFWSLFYSVWAMYDTVDPLLSLEGFSWLLWHHFPLGFLLFFWQSFFFSLLTPRLLWPGRCWWCLNCASGHADLLKVRHMYLLTCCPHSHIQFLFRYLKSSMSQTELVIFLPSSVSSLVFLILVNNVHLAIQVRNMV